MQVKLPPALEAFVQAKVESGTYSSIDEVVQEALRLLRLQDRFFEEKLQRLREALIEGEQSGIAEDFSLEGLLAELDREVLEK